ncbi:MAG: MBL fold metallo-hydrolase [Candidatus Kerfeldbacteria bacterium]|nr:MBL fold metallo-hydrolase [Candidatus Kerfeldbacteria bacterium]
MIVSVLVVVAVVCIVLIVQTTPHPFRFVMLDVGQGDASFLETPTGEQMLVDGGPSDTVLERLGRAMPFFDRTIDVVILTHGDADHITGLVEVIRRYRIGRLLIPGVEKDTATYREFLDAARERNVPLTTVRDGDGVTLGDVTVTILAPFDATLGLSVNNAGVVARADMDDFSILLTADIETPVEQLLISRGAMLDADVLKVPHHGSHSSSTEPFLRAVGPDLALISVGEDNRYGHPHSDVVKRYQDLRIPILRTDEGSDIRLDVVGKNVSVHRGLGFRVW